MGRKSMEDEIDPIVIVSKAPPPDIREMFRDRAALQAAQQRARVKLMRQNNFTPTPEQPFLPD